MVQGKGHSSSVCQMLFHLLLYELCSPATQEKTQDQDTTHADFLASSLTLRAACNVSLLPTGSSQ